MLARFFSLACVLLSGIFLFGNHVDAATIYANSATGNDVTGSGTVGAPYQTFHKAYTSASSGDIIDLNGTFTWTDAAETGDVSNTGYALAKNLTIRGQGMGSTIVQASTTVATADRGVFAVSSGSTVTLQDMTIRHGVSGGGQRAGGVSNYGTLTLIRMRVTGNRYNSTSYYGAGGVFTDTNTTITVSTSTIEGNDFIGRYYGSGGMYALQNTTINIYNSSFTYNTSTSDNPNTFAFSYAAPSGGFGTFRFGAGRITNSTFAHNWTNSYGGAIQIYYKDSFTITNSTIAHNSSTYGAGGILYQSEWNGYNLYLKNTILADNTGAGSANDFHAYDAASASRITDNGYNVVEFSTNKTWSGTGNVTGNQASLNLSASPATNDSSQGTLTLALSSGSICIDAGNSTANNGIAVPSTDQRGASRNGTVDIGAFEYGGTGLVSTYTFTYAAGANGSISGTNPQTVNAGADGSAVTAVPTTGYHFTTWSDASTANPRTDTNASANISVTASFAINNYLLTYTAGVGGTLSGSSTQSIAHGSSGSAISAVPNSGYSFVSWSDGSTANPRTDASVTTTISVTASFADVTAPVISNIGATAANNTGTITWNTDEVASSRVAYGLSPSLGTWTSEADLAPRVTNHTVSLSGLAACTTYHYAVISADASANAATGTTATLVTAGCPTTTSASGSGGSGYTPPPSIGNGGREATVGMFESGALGHVDRNGINYLTYVGSRATFHLNGLSGFGLDLLEMDLVKKQVTVRILPSGQVFDLPLGSRKLFDANGDGISDLSVRFRDIYVNRAELTLEAASPASSELSPGTLVSAMRTLEEPKPSVCSASFTRDLRLGMRGADVTELQRCLQQTGHLTISSFTTYFGMQTRSALTRYQREHNLPATGYFGRLTKASLKAK